jgi:hypothetical protein
MAKKEKFDLATIFFLGIILVSIVGAIIPFNQTIVWLVLGICGAIVAIQNIQIKEETSFLIGVIGLITVLSAFLLIPELRYALRSSVGTFLLNLVIGFGVSGFVVALGLISRLGLEK